jgi:hypothetical protein
LKHFKMEERNRREETTREERKKERKDENRKQKRGEDKRRGKWEEDKKVIQISDRRKKLGILKYTQTNKKY